MKQLRVDIDHKVHNTFIKQIPWGYTGKLVRALISMCIDATQSHGAQVVYDIIKGKCIIKYKENEDEC